MPILETLLALAGLLTSSAWLYLTIYVIGTFIMHGVESVMELVIFIFALMMLVITTAGVVFFLIQVGEFIA